MKCLLDHSPVSTALLLTVLCQPLSSLLTALSAMFDSQNQPSVDSYMPQRVLSSSVSPRQRSDRPPWCECPFSFM